MGTNQEPSRLSKNRAFPTLSRGPSDRMSISMVNLGLTPRLTPQAIL